MLQNFTQLWRLKSAQVAKRPGGAPAAQLVLGSSAAAWPRRRGRLERALQAVARAPGVLEELQRPARLGSAGLGAAVLCFRLLSQLFRALQEGAGAPGGGRRAGGQAEGAPGRRCLHRC